MGFYGYFLSCEEYGPSELVRQAKLAADAGFDGLWISDHFHPWNEAQGESAFVWEIVGAISAVTALPIATAVTCPIIRIHPAILAQASATAALLTDGGFSFGVGTGENLNEHILGDRWPPVDVRLEMLEEAVDVIRRLWTGKLVSHHGRYFTVENARLYSVPDSPPPILVSAFGSKALEVASRIGDGYIGASPDPRLVNGYSDRGGRGPRAGGLKICWGADEAECRRTAHRLWGTNAIPGEAGQEFAMPAHFEQASALVDESLVTRKISCGPDLDTHLQSVRSYEQTGYDQVFIAQVGGAGEDFFQFAADELLPGLRR